MNYVFISPDQKFMKVQYIEFRHKKKTELLLLNEKNRRISKGFKMSHLMPEFIHYNLFYGYFENSIGKVIIEKKWTDKICFIVYSRLYESYGSSLVKYLRNKFPNCVVVTYFGDIIKTHKLDMNNVKKDFDEVLTFDMSDADEYGLDWCLEPFSYSVFKQDRFRDNTIKWDVTFVGKAKNRYKKIIELYEFLENKGLVCDFHITDVSKKDQIYQDKIHYGGLDFVELLDHVNHSRCVAEVLQSDAVSPTTRYAEAMLLNKKLITDCRYFSDETNRSDSIVYFDKVQDLNSFDKSVLLREADNQKVDYKEMFSIGRMTETINRYLEGSSYDSSIKA